MAEAQALDPRKASLAQLDDLKIEYAEEVGHIVAKLSNDAKRKDGVAIIKRIADDLEQLFLIGEEIGRREGIKEQQHHDSTTG